MATADRERPTHRPTNHGPHACTVCGRDASETPLRPIPAADELDRDRAVCPSCRTAFRSEGSR